MDEMIICEKCFCLIDHFSKFTQPVKKGRITRAHVAQWLLCSSGKRTTRVRILVFPPSNTLGIPSKLELTRLLLGCSAFGTGWLPGFSTSSVTSSSSTCLLSKPWILKKDLYNKKLNVRFTWTSRMCSHPALAIPRTRELRNSSLRSFWKEQTQKSGMQQGEIQKIHNNTQIVGKATLPVRVETVSTLAQSPSWTDRTLHGLRSRSFLQCLLLLPISKVFIVYGQISAGKWNSKVKSETQQSPQKCPWIRPFHQIKMIAVLWSSWTHIKR